MTTLLTAITYAVVTAYAYWVWGGDIALAVGIGMFIGLCNGALIVFWYTRQP